MLSKFVCGVGLVAIACTAPIANAAAATADGSNYLQCDGAPNNMSGGERAARLLGALTLLTLFVPAPEDFDATKRKLGTDGVAACSALIDGANREGNPARRVQLILARALHRIEAKDYTGALDDVKQAETEAGAAGLTANPYFMRSQGRAFGLIRSAALFRLDRPEEAQAAALSGAASVRNSTIPLEAIPDYSIAIPHGSPAEEDYLRWRTLNRGVYGRLEANRLEEIGRFAEARAVRESQMDYNGRMAKDGRSSLLMAESALTRALSGDMAGATKLLDEAKANFALNTTNGKPEDLRAEYVEVLDLFAIVTMAQTDIKAARRQFAARSEWPSASFGYVMEINRRLRAGAAPNELTGALAKDPAQMFAERAAAAKAALLATDRDNKALWYLLPRTIGENSYFAASKRVWNVKKSPLLITPNVPLPYEMMSIPDVDTIVQGDAMKLHAALLAKSRGHQGFAFVLLLQDPPRRAAFVTGNRGEPGLADANFNDADAVIADLSPILPDPATVEARKKARK